MTSFAQLNDPLIGQRVHLGEGWVQKAGTFRILGVLTDGEGDTLVSFDLNEHSPSARRIVGIAIVAGPGKDSGSFTGDVVHTIFGSRSRNLDPQPYVDGHTNSAGDGRRFAEPYHVDGDGTDCPYCVTTYAPRPEYDTAPIHGVNPILAQFRTDFDAQGVHGAADYARGWLEFGTPLSREWWNPLVITDEHIEHARRVIERLAAL